MKNLFTIVGKVFVDGVEHIGVKVNNARSQDGFCMVLSRAVVFAGKMSFYVPFLESECEFIEDSTVVIPDIDDAIKIADQEICLGSFSIQEVA